MRLLNTCFFLALAPIVAIAGGPVRSEEAYRLNAGDKLRIEIGGAENPDGRIVDPDGQLFVPGLGRIRVAGQTLDEAEAAISAANADREVYLDDSVALQLLESAPVFVGGAVRTPGTVPFVPGMTAGAAAALAGGPIEPGLTVEGASRLRAELEGALLEERTRRASLALEIARLSTEGLGDEDDVDSRIEGSDLPDRALLDPKAIERAQAAAHASIAERRHVLAAIDASIAEEDARIGIFEQRIENANVLVRLRKEDLERNLTLVERGIIAASAQLNFEVAASAAEELALQAQSMLAEARSRRSTLWEERVRFVAGLERARTATIAAAGATIAALEARIAGLENRRRTAGIDTLLVSYTVSRNGLIVGASFDALVRPGDLVLVSNDRTSDWSDG